MTLDVSSAGKAIEGLMPGFWLAAGRSRGYKNVHILTDGVLLAPSERLVVTGDVPLADRRSSERVWYVGIVSESELRWLYSNCKGVISVAFEDFGLTPVEGYAFGAPALCLRAGGFLDTIQEGVTGQYIEAPTPQSVAVAVREFTARFNVADLKAAADIYAPERFRAAITAEVRRHTSPKDSQ
jgi:glycosyltransferase involved in cell wall biosynthesis